MGELFESFGLAMATGVLCIYVVLVLLFKDFVQPATILAALVLSIPGAFLALFVTQSSLSMPSMIGLIMLMGIATKNSILLIDYVVLARREHGLNRWEALLDACRKRARPIVMTTIAMGAGMTPIALGLGVTQLPRAHGHRRDRRPDHQHLPQPAGDPGGLHLRRRPVAMGGPRAPAPPCRGLAAGADWGVICRGGPRSRADAPQHRTLVAALRAALGRTRSSSDAHLHAAAGRRFACFQSRSRCPSRLHDAGRASP